MRMPLGLPLLMLPATPAAAQDRTRVDLYDAKSRREGYAIIDRESGRVDAFDKNSKRTGYGKIAPDGKLDLYRPDATSAGTSTRERSRSTR